METFPIDKESLRSGLLRIPSDKLRAELSDFTRLIQRFVNGGYVFLQKFSARECQISLLYHQPFWDEENFNYDVGNSVRRVVSGKSIEWKYWLETEMRQLEFEHRTLSACWILDGLWEFTLVLGSGLLSLEKRESLNWTAPLFGCWFMIFPCR